MASYSNIPSAILVLFLLLFLSPPFIHQAHNLVAADYQLILEECHNSDTPVICINCVKSDPGAEKADKLGIATIVVNCISNEAKILVANVTSLASKTKDPKVKSVCRDCANWYSAAQEELTFAKKALENHKYDDAERCVVEAMQSDIACHDEIPMIHNIPISIDLLYKIRVYEELSEAALRIIERL